MSGGTQLTSRVSATLRAAGLPVLRYIGRKDARGRSGIRVQNDFFPGSCWVSVRVWIEETSFTDDEAEREWSDKARAVLIARGFDVSHQPDSTTLVVRNRAKESVPAVEDVAAVTASSGLSVSQPAPNEWHVAVNGRRGVYSIRRTGSGDRIRYAVHGRGLEAPVKNLPTMAAALEVVERELKGKS